MVLGKGAPAQLSVRAGARAWRFHFVAPITPPKELVVIGYRAVTNAESVLVRQQQRGHAPIPFRDDPKPFTAVEGIARQQPALMSYRVIIQSSIFWRDAAPIARLVTLQELSGIGCGAVEQIECAAGGYHVAEGKQARGRRMGR